MEIAQLREIIAICDEGSLSQAAQKLHTSTSSLSRSMKRLEDDLRVPLFERTRNSIRLNSAGLFVVMQARTIVDDCALLRRRVREHEQRHRTVRIGTCAPSPAWLMLTTAAERSPDLIVSSELLGEDEIERRLDDDVIDVAILAHPAQRQGMRSVHLIDEALLLSVPADHPLASRSTLALADLDGQPVLVHAGNGYWNDLFRRKLSHSELFVQTDYMVFLEQVRSSALPAFITDAPSVPPFEGRISKPIADPEMHAAFYAVTKDDAAGRWETLISWFQPHTEHT